VQCEDQLCKRKEGKLGVLDSQGMLHIVPIQKSEHALELVFNSWNLSKP
jgi:hypothetical protein